MLKKLKHDQVHSSSIFLKKASLALDGMLFIHDVINMKIKGKKIIVDGT